MIQYAVDIVSFPYVFCHMWQYTIS